MALNEDALEHMLQRTRGQPSEPYAVKMTTATEEFEVYERSAPQEATAPSQPDFELPAAFRPPPFAAEAQPMQRGIRPDVAPQFADPADIGPTQTDPAAWERTVVRPEAPAQPAPMREAAPLPAPAPEAAPPAPAPAPASQQVAAPEPVPAPVPEPLQESVPVRAPESAPEPAHAPLAAAPEPFAPPAPATPAMPETPDLSAWVPEVVAPVPEVPLPAAPEPVEAPARAPVHAPAPRAYTPEPARAPVAATRAAPMPTYTPAPAQLAPPVVEPAAPAASPIIEPTEPVRERPAPAIAFRGVTANLPHIPAPAEEPAPMETAPIRREAPAPEVHEATVTAPDLRSAMRAPAGSGSGPDGARVAIVQADFNTEITDAMAELAREKASALGATVTHHLHVAGVYDLPLSAQVLARRDDVDVVVVLGCVIQGQTGHDVTITDAAAAKICDIACATETPIGLGVIGPRMTKPQAMARVGNGAYALAAALHQWESLKALSAGTSQPRPQAATH